MSEPIQPIDDEGVVQTTLAEAWRLFTGDFVLYFLAGLLLIVVSGVSLGLLSGPMTVGFIMLIERRRRGEPASATDIFDGFSFFGPSVIASILIAVGIVIGFLFFVLPGLLFGLAMIFTYPAITIDNETATGGMAKSVSILTENFALSAMFLIIVAALAALGGAIGIGIVLTLPFNLILITLAYHRLRDA
jgi:hypothetical protein